MSNNVENLYNPLFAEDWNSEKLFDLAKWKNGLAFKNLSFSNSGLPIIKIAELNNGISTQTKYTEQIFDKNVFLTNGDMVFSWSGNPMTSIDVFWYRLADGWLNQHIFKVNPNQTVNDSFLYYMLKYLKPMFQGIASNKQTTGLGHVTIADLKEMNVGLPPLEEQKAIADVLSALDDKIELNNRINKNLEQQAQAIFKRWFVDFEFFDENGNPYKSSGGEMQDSELGEIPKGWDMKKFSDFCLSIIGGDWGKETSESNYIEEVICIRGADIPEIAKGNNGNCPRRFINTKNLKNKQLREGDIIIEISGGSPTQSTGRSALIETNFINSKSIPLICTNFCRAIKLNDKSLTAYFYMKLQELYCKSTFFSYENGTTGIKNLDLNGLLEQENIVLPNKVLVDLYNNIFYKSRKIIFNNCQENQKLAELRDYLLPKFMSGAIKVDGVHNEKR